MCEISEIKSPVVIEISKNDEFPKLFYAILELCVQTVTAFSQTFLLFFLKKPFYNSLVPVIQIYGKKYKYNKPIRTKNELENLLENIYNIEKCSGIFGLVYTKWRIGYFEGSLEEDIHMWSGSQKWVVN